MQLSFRPDLNDFRQEIASFIKQNLPYEIHEKVARGEAIDKIAHTAWQKQLVNRGWGAPSWPTDHGGTGWSLSEQYIFEQELAKHHAPRAIFFGFDLLGPTLMEYGTNQQKDYFLPKILQGDLWLCQGFSEPNAGSDLAALQCKAVNEGDHYVINGSKLWTSEAFDADWMFGLFRTASRGKRQFGITVLLLKMGTPGLSVEPIRTFDGGIEINQCFFDDVKVPVTQRLGPEHDGWNIAKYMLSRERLGIAEVPRTRAIIERLKELSYSETASHDDFLTDPVFRSQISQVEIELLTLEATEQNYLFSNGEVEELGAEVCLLKIRGSELQQRATELILDALAYHGLPDQLTVPERTNYAVPGPKEALNAARWYFNNRKLSIYGGSNEIQKNIISKAVLGL